MANIAAAALCVTGLFQRAQKPCGYGDQVPSSSFTGLQVLHEPQNPTACLVDIIYIPDIVADRSEAWNLTVPEFSWLRALLPTEVPAARILAFGYNPTVGSMSEIISMGSVRRYALSLLEAVAQLREQDANRSKNVDNRPILYVAHGLGGIALVITSTEERLRRLPTLTYGIILLGVPHFRAGYAQWAVMISTLLGLPTKGIKRQDWSPFSQDFDDLAEMQTKFCNMIERRGGENDAWIKRVICFYEELAIPIHKLILSPEWSVIPGVPSGAIAKDHFSMAKFKTADEFGFQRIARELSWWLTKLGTPLIP
ncbi:hypothetical protein F5Y14DRAFT_459556 [Nemania sp. NC0429]|nr:hypothetical protein F5Y14DRAFT_459556 [Nemania sp. NC0429]